MGTSLYNITTKRVLIFSMLGEASTTAIVKIQLVLQKTKAAKLRW